MEIKAVLDGISRTKVISAKTWAKTVVARQVMLEQMIALMTRLKDQMG